MAAEEVIHFPFWAQASLRPHSSALSPPEPVAEPPPSWTMERHLSSLTKTFAGSHAVRPIGF